MKPLTIYLLVFSFSGLSGLKANAQFLGGFFSQQSQKEKLMATQVAEYDMWLSALKTGYTITEKGLNTAHDLKNGTFSLHSGYFNSLEQVSPAVQQNPKGKAIVAMQQQIITLFAAELTWQQQQKLLHATEIAYLQKVRDNLLNKCKLDRSELTDVLTPGKLQLTDAQRLERVDKLYDSMKDKLAFAGYFTAKCRKLAIARQQHQQDNQQLKSLYGVQ